ncbi:MAG: hypothetical protein Q4E16_07310 [Neisseria sp.]|nr:hypothetical protein [Neisseria sp.]
MTKPHIKPTYMPSAEIDWEQSLRDLRERKAAAQTPARPAAPSSVMTPTQTAQTAQAEIKPKKIVPSFMSAEQKQAQQQVMKSYLTQWIDGHNQQAQVEPETDNMVLLEEDWLNAQMALQGEVSEDLVEQSTTVWVNPKHAAAVEAKVATDEAATPASDEDADGIEREHIPVSVNVLNPKGIDVNQPVFCLSEQELLSRISARLLPHLTDAVNGMVRTAVQRQAAQLTYHLQQSLAEETPELVKEILDYNVKSALAEIKYQMKFKR